MTNMQSFGLTTSAAGACLMCAVDHNPFQPHDMNPVYENVFWTMYHRWPTMEDSSAHCAPEVREKWLKSMKEAMGEIRASNPVSFNICHAAFCQNNSVI